MSRREREETQPEEEVKVEDFLIPFNDATSSSAAAAASSSSSSSSSIVFDPKYSYLQHLDLSELSQNTKTILLENEIGFKSLLKIDKGTLKELGIKVGDIVSLLAFAKECKQNGNVAPRVFAPSPPISLLPLPPQPTQEKPTDDGSATKLSTVAEKKKAESVSQLEDAVKETSGAASKRTTRGPPATNVEQLEAAVAIAGLTEKMKNTSRRVANELLTTKVFKISSFFFPRELINEYLVKTIVKQ